MEGGVKEKLLIKEKKTSEQEEEELSLVKRVWNESKVMWVVAAPGIFTRFSTFGINVISQAFIGHIGSRELAAYALVFTVLIRFANGILLGMASALSTLCGQAYGAKEYVMMGVHLQRSWIVMSITSLFLLPVFIFTRPILMLLGQDENIAEVAGNISLWSIPMIFAFIASFTCQNFLQSQSKNTIISFLAAFSIVIHLFLSWLLTIQFKLEIPGAMTSTNLAFWIPNIGQLIFITCGWCSDTWKGFSFLAFKDLWPVVKLSLSSGIILELWYNTILVLLTGNMENAEVQIDALSICLNINGWEMMISLGFMAAASVRVANELGKGSSKAAKFSIVVTVLTSLAIGFVLFLFFLFLRGKLAYIFTSNKDVADAVGDLSPLLAISILLNSVQPVLSGVAIGAGWQSIVAYVNIGCYYIIGIPVGVVLGNVLNLQVKGIWIGMLFGTFIQTVVLTVITYKTDWDEQVTKARNRINKWSKVESDHETITSDDYHGFIYGNIFSVARGSEAQVADNKENIIIIRRGGIISGEEGVEREKLMWVVAAPAIFTRFSTFGINVITHAFVGHIGSRELAAFALVFLIRFANGILLGMGTALSILCGQAYGAKEYGMMGVYLQRSWIVLSLTALCLLPLLIFAIPILTLLDQDETIAQVAGTISLWSIPVLFSFIVSFTTQTFLQSQSKNIIIAFLAAFSIVIHVFLSWLLTMKFKLGIAGAMTSTSLALWIPNIGQLIFITCGWCSDTWKWKGFSFLAFKDLWPVVKLSLSSGAMCSSCKRKLQSCKEKLAYIFTSSKDVADAVGDLSPLLAISILLNSVQPVLSGIPVGVVLGNVLHLQVKGIWFGMLFGTFIQTIVLIIITYKTNWDEQTQKMEGNLEKKLLSKEEVSEEDNLSLVKRVWEESKEMWIVAAPAIFTRFTTFGINVISQAFIGHIGSRELAAYALVFTVIIRFANGILLGMSSALSTLCGQAYGAKEYDMMGVYLQRSSIVLFLTALCLLPVFIFTSPILMLLGQDENIAQVAGTISLWSIPILFAYIVSFNCQTFLQSQSKNVVIAFLAALSIIIHVFLSWLLTIQFKFGIPGAMISTILAFWIPNIGQLIFITCGWCDETWKGFSFLAFKDLGPVVKLSLSSGAIININGWEMMIAFGFMAAASVRVANELGRGSSKDAKFSIVVTVLTSFSIGFILFVLFLFLREKVAYLFTSNEDVATAVGDLSPLLAVSLLLNSIQPVLSGVAVGAGWQSIVAYVNIGCYYLIGIPVGIVLGNIIHLQVKGIWIGMLFGTLIQTIVLTIITYKTNWDEQVIIARNRISKWSKVDLDRETVTSDN
ncbi:Protein DETOXIFICATION 21 [Glycine soja]